MSNRIIPSFIQELLEHGINIELTKDSFLVSGFYKSGTVEVKCRGEHDWYAKARYNETKDIEELRDLVSLNHTWWVRGKDRWPEGWSQPDSNWVPLLEKFEFITPKTIPAKVIYE